MEEWNFLRFWIWFDLSFRSFLTSSHYNLIPFHKFPESVAPFRASINLGCCKATFASHYTQDYDIGIICSGQGRQSISIKVSAIRNFIAQVLKKRGENHGLDGKDEEAVEWLSNKIYQINIEMGPYAASLVNNFRIRSFIL